MSNELYHYGVVGMRWGVRRSMNELRESKRTGNKGAHNHAVAVLSGHRDKINKKLTKLDKKSDELESQRYNQVTKDAVKIAKLENKSEKALMKSYKTKSVEKAEKYKQKSVALNYKASELKKAAAKMQAKIEKNNKLKETYKSKLNEINDELVKKGQDFLYMKSDGTPYTKGDIE